MGKVIGIDFTVEQKPKGCSRNADISATALFMPPRNLFWGAALVKN